MLCFVKSNSFTVTLVNYGVWRGFYSLLKCICLWDKLYQLLNGEMAIQELFLVV